MPSITIDGHTIEVEAGTNLIEAARRLGIDIPFYCYHPQLSVVASCRMCLVDVEKSPKPLPACATLATDGMVVHTDTPAIHNERKHVLEFLLLNHPLDCPICDKAGECLLQDYSFAHGTVVSRMHEEKRVPPKKDLGTDVILYTTRCILCSRCTRFMSEVAGTGELGVMNRGARAEIDLYPGVELGEGMTGNIVDICPVGALKSKDFLFQARVWNLDHADSTCGGCATGCSIQLDTLRGAVKRIRPRDNPEVNGPWICDEGRFLWHEYYRKRERILEPMVRHAGNGKVLVVTWAEAFAEVARHLGPHAGPAGDSSVAFIGSAYATNEDNWYLRKLGESLFPRRVMSIYPAREDREDRVFKNGFRIDGDRTPNRQGALAVLGLDRDSPADVWTGIETGRIRAAIMLGGGYRDHLGDRERALLARLEFLVVLDATASELTAAAHVVLPSVPYTEKDGTFMNVTGRIQKIARAVEPPGRARDEAGILRHLARALGRDLGSAAPDVLFDQLAPAVPAMNGLRWSDIGPLGAPGARLASTRMP